MGSYSMQWANRPLSIEAIAIDKRSGFALESRSQNGSDGLKFFLTESKQWTRLCPSHS